MKLEVDLNQPLPTFLSSRSLSSRRRPGGRKSVRDIRAGFGSASWLLLVSTSEPDRRKELIRSPPLLSTCALRPQNSSEVMAAISCLSSELTQKRLPAGDKQATCAMVGSTPENMTV